MNKSIVCLSIGFIALLTEGTYACAWEMQSLQIPTKWAAAVGPDNALPEYPRPQLVRRNWQNLNGLWEYAITAVGASKPAKYDGTILVPYPLESALSGVEKPLRPDQALWYRRNISVARQGKGHRVLMHFGAVDYQATLFINGREIGTHTGGYQSFDFDVTYAIRAGSNEIVVRALDPGFTGPNPRGKQGVYTSTSGIWQTVWMESVPETYIDGLTMTPDVDQRALLLQVRISGGASAGYSVRAIATSGTDIVADQSVFGPTSLHIRMRIYGRRTIHSCTA